MSSPAVSQVLSSLDAGLYKIYYQQPNNSSCIKLKMKETTLYSFISGIVANFLMLLFSLKKLRF